MEIVRYSESYRTESEDRAEIIETERGVVLVVADGVGGRSGGERAAEVAVARVREAVPTVRNLEDPKVWYHLARDLDGELAADEDAGQTTLVIAAVTARRIVGVSAGDSEAWVVQPEGHYDLTGGQKRKPFLGSGADLTAFTLRRPGRGTLLLATDGLFKYAPAERILETAVHPEWESVPERLADLVRLPGGKLPDDLALIACRFTSEILPGFALFRQWLSPTREKRRRDAGGEGEK